jgi:hypothetical protein
MTRSILVSLLTLAIGLGVGYLIGSAREAQAPSRSNRPATTVQRDQPPREALPAGASEFAEVLHELPVPSYTRGSGRITGVVRDAEGNGVAGVTIRATQHGKGGSRRKGDGAPGTDTLEETVRKAVERYHWRSQTTVDVVTDSGGAYLLGGLADREYQLQAYLKGHVIEAAKGARVWNVKPGTTIDWTAGVVVTVPVDVLLPDGTRPPQAWIQRKQGNSTTSEQWSPERREIRVPPGAYTLSVSLGGNEEYRSDAVDAIAESGRSAEPIIFQLSGRPGIRGNIRFATGDRLSSLRVFALRFSGDKPPSNEQLGAQGKETWGWKNNNFEFSFMDLPPGRYLLGVGTRKGSIFTTKTVDVGAQLVTTELVVEQIDPKHYVLVRVLGPDGKPIAVDQMSTSYKAGNSSSSGGGTWARRTDGSYMVFHHDHENEEGGTFGVEVTANKYGKKSFNYKQGKQREFELRFREPAKLSVTVQGFAGAEHADKVTLGLRTRTSEQQRVSAARDQAPDGDGRAVLGPVESGDYELVLYIRIGRHQSVPAVRKTISLPAGESETSLAMPGLHELVVTGKKGDQFHLSGDRDAGVFFHQSLRCGDDGRALFGPLPAGSYSLRMNRKPGEMAVTVPGPEVVFQASEHNALRVSIRDPEGALAKAGFADGDLVVGVNGAEFKGTVQMQMLFAGAMMKGDDATLTILRGGRTVELTINLKDVMQGADSGPGGSVRPTVR